MNRRFAPLLLAALVAPAPVLAQSILNAAGLGLPVEPLDARSLALGGIGVGLRGPVILGSHPAAAAEFSLPSVVFTAQPTWVAFGRSDTGESGDFRGNRFPTLGVAYPASDWGVATLTLETIVDQRFEAQRPVSLQLVDGPVEGLDSFVSDGGVSQVRLGFARALGDDARVGVSVGRYAGSVVRRLVRTVQDTVALQTFESFQSGGRWSYSGTSVTGSASVSLGDFAEVGGALIWSNGLDAEASDDTEGSDRSYDLPLRLRLGATAVLAPGLSVVAGLSRADWSDIDDDLEDGRSVGATSTYSAGVELTRASLFGRNAPLRLGYRRSDLPFTLTGGSPTETAWTGGLGLTLDQVGEIVRAGVDLALERGRREDATVTEKFWRASLTLRVSGF